MSSFISGGGFLCTEHSDVKHKAESVSHLAATTGEVEQVLLSIPFSVEQWATENANNPLS